MAKKLHDGIETDVHVKAGIDRIIKVMEKMELR
jgi:hypothetical protein